VKLHLPICAHKKINWYCSVKTRYFPSLTATWLNSNIETRQTFLLLLNYLRHCNRNFYLSHFLRHYFPASLIHIYSLVLLKVKINSSCVWAPYHGDVCRARVHRSWWRVASRNICGFSVWNLFTPTFWSLEFWGGS